MSAKSTIAAGDRSPPGGSELSALARSRLRRFAAGAAIALGFCAWQVGAPGSGWFGALDRWTYDARLRMRDTVADDRIVIVDIDERSLAEQGRWPWPRAVLADLSRRLTDDGQAAVVGFDVVFAEPSRAAGDDDAFAAALTGHRVHLGYYFGNESGGRGVGVLPAPVLPAHALRPGQQVTSWDGYGANLAQLQAAADGAGFLNPLVDPDGVVRALPLLAAHGEQLYSSLALGLLRDYLGAAALVVSDQTIALRGARGAVSLPISAGMTALVPFAGSKRPFRYVSASDVLAGRADPRWFADRIVLVGTSAPGLTDLRATPIGATFPGVQIHAQLISGALAGTINQRPADAGLLAAVGMGLVGLALAASAPLIGPLGVLLVGVISLGTLVAWNTIAFSNFALMLPLTAGLAMVLVLTLFNLAAGYLTEGRARRAVVALFGEYVSPELVKQMALNPLSHRADASMDREVTVLFADIRGFTAMAEKMQPEQLREYLNEFLTAMTEVIHAHRGTLDKYIGDAVMAFWGAPLEDPAHADRAVEAALAMQIEAQRLSRRFVERGLPPLAVGIGINSGVVRVGEMGSKLRRAYTVIGDAVNLAARLEGLTKRFEVPVILGEGTARLCRQMQCTQLERVTVAGRIERVAVFVPAPADGAPGVLRIVPQESAELQESVRKTSMAGQ